MKITSQEEYGVRCLLRLARSHGEQSLTIPEIAAAENRLPIEAEMCAAIASVKRTHWKLDVIHGAATHTSDAPLALNSFVKSYIAGRAADAALRASGVRAVVVNIGGDVVIRGEWSEPVDVADPKSDAENGVPIAHLVLRNRAIATSGGPSSTTSPSASGGPRRSATIT